MASVMIVDDSVTSRRFLRKMIEESRKHTVACEAVNGEEAVRKYKNFSPDIVTMDIAMPLMNGVYATVEILKYDPGATIIMVSSMSDKNLVVTAMKRGAKSYMLKPVENDKLLNTLEQVLNDNADSQN